MFLNNDMMTSYFNGINFNPTKNLLYGHPAKNLGKRCYPRNFLILKNYVKKFPTRNNSASTGYDE